MMAPWGKKCRFVSKNVDIEEPTVSDNVQNNGFIEMLFDEICMPEDEISYLNQSKKWRQLKPLLYQECSTN